MARVDFGNNRGENLADPLYDKDAVNKRTLARNISNVKGSFLALTGGTVSGDVVISGDTTIEEDLIVSGDTIIQEDLTVNGITKTTGRIKNVRQVTITNSDYSTSPTKGYTLGDEVIFIKDDLTGGGGVGQYNFNLTGLIGSKVPEGTTFEMIKIKDGTGGNVRIGATVPFGSNYTLNGVTNGQLNVCSDIHTSVTLIKSGSTAIICYGTGL